MAKNAIANLAFRKLRAFNNAGLMSKMDNIRYYCQKNDLQVPFKKSANKFLTNLYLQKDSPIGKGVLGLLKKKPKKSKKERKQNYFTYLRSAKWFNFKKQLIAERGHRCEKCGATPKSLDGHHLTYARLFNEIPEDIQLLCRPCHNAIHEAEKSKPKVVFKKDRREYKYRKPSDVPSFIAELILCEPRSVAVMEYLITPKCYEFLKLEYELRKEQ